MLLLDDDQVAALLRCSTRTARRYLHGWRERTEARAEAILRGPATPARLLFAQGRTLDEALLDRAAGELGLPRVSWSTSTRAGGRPGYRVDAAGFARWLRGEMAAVAEAA